MGYVVHTTAWLAHAACDLALNWLGVLAPAYVIASPFGAVKYEQSAKYAGRHLLPTYLRSASDHPHH